MTNDYNSRCRVTQGMEEGQNMVAVDFDILLPFNLLQQGKQSFIKAEKFIFTTFK